MAQLAEIILAILGLSGAASMPAVCCTILGCEIVRLIADYIEKYS